ncbi:aldehyde dehydrogenase family protein [Salipiger sp. 1_MG-2023]|uniref:aldehyde dehydrogenase family protein n=1 Tax=Salipiger sp. 1_MG-2023 TaxID=3062665 RepID=UPI0026E3E8FC|nr:aldehyde dehydrogenase family protein [Salipiger sp. 1_MG-2023]MDO6586534.1 aldehyde dehydrogenase family protein [Salipiger sp. 1_MG-2023]
MTILDKHYIDGVWTSGQGGRDFPILNPASEAQIGTVTLGTAADVDRAVAAAARSFESYSRTTKTERLGYLRALQAALEARINDMGDAISAEMGAPITLARNAQAGCGPRHAAAYVAALEAHSEEYSLPNGDIIRKDPIGVCGLITPWNWPINQIAQKVMPALAVGATCVLKPSEHTPLSAAIFAQCVHEAGLPAGVFNLVFGDGPGVGSAMSRHPDLAMMSFTGSTRAGAMVSRDSAETVKRVALELGGKSANLIFADADLETCVAASVQRCFLNTGQGCNAPTRMLVERSCYDAVLDLARKAAEAQAVDDPAKEGGHIGPLFDKMQFERVQAMIQLGLDEGARLLAGGPGRPEGFDKGWFVRPTIFADVSNDMRIAREEIFGPVLCIIPFDTEEDAIRIANDSDYGLAAYVQTGSAGRARRVARQLRAGVVAINGQGASYGSPFGGYKHSGNGREGGAFGLEEYLEVKVMPSIDAMADAGRFTTD